MSASGGLRPCHPRPMRNTPDLGNSLVEPDPALLRAVREPCERRPVRRPTDDARRAVVRAAASCGPRPRWEAGRRSPRKLLCQGTGHRGQARAKVRFRTLKADRHGRFREVAAEAPPRRQPGGASWGTSNASDATRRRPTPFRGSGRCGRRTWRRAEAGSAARCAGPISGHYGLGGLGKHL